MEKKRSRFRIGLRTVKTAAAVVISMIIVDLYGATASKLIFAMLGAMAAVQPTFKESWESCVTQIVGVLFGAVVGLVLVNLPIHPLVAVGIGMILAVPADQAEKALANLKAAGETAYEIGKVVAGQDGVTLV